MAAISVLELYLFTILLILDSCSGQQYSETCVNSFYQDYGLIHLPPSSLFRHPPALSCRWTFTAKEGDYFVITIHKFYIEDFADCGRGYAEILDGLSNTSKSILPKTCSSMDTPSHFKSKTSSVSIIFYSKYFHEKDSLLASIRTVSTTVTYKFHPGPLRWREAREFCRKNNGNLASVYPVPSKALADLIESDHNITDAWVGQFVTPWVWLKGCTKWDHRQELEPRYLNSKYNQKTECSMACLGYTWFLLQGGTCYCIPEHHHLHLGDGTLAEECDIPCPGNREEKCGGKEAFTYYESYDVAVRNKATYEDCVSESISSFDARDCHSEFGFSCDFRNGSTVTYYSKANKLPWNKARAFCEGLPDSIGLRPLPHWPFSHIKVLWTSNTRGQHWNYPQIYNTSLGPEEAYIATVDKYNQYELKLRNADHRYGFLCEYQIPTCGDNFTSTTGDLQTPNFPNQYGPNQFCQWTITVPEPDRIRLEFSEFKLEDHELCLYDFVQVVDSKDSLKDVRFCGNLIPRVFLSGGRKITVIFKSDNSVTATGFKAHWKAVDPSYRESESNASRKGLGGGAVAGIILGTAVVVILLFLIFFVLYRKRHKSTISTGSTVSNQIYGISSFSDDSITQGERNYANIQMQRNPDVVQQCFTNSVRDDLEDLDDVFDYEGVCENRLELEAAEYFGNSGSQANLIASDADDDQTEAEVYAAPKKHKKNDSKPDNITVESTLSLDDIENIGINAITVVDNSEGKDISFDDGQTYAGASNKDSLPLDLLGDNQIHVQSKYVTDENNKDSLLGYEIPQTKAKTLYRNLEDGESHAALAPAPSHTYEEMDVANNIGQNQNIQHLLSPAAAAGHATVSQVPSHAYAEIGDIET